MLEGTFNLRLVKSVKRRHIWAQKMADRFTPGIPDIYIAGGNWIESKVVQIGGQRGRSVDLSNKMTEEQHNWAAAALTSEDRVMFCARIETPDSKHLMLIPYRLLIAQEIWDGHELRSYPEIKSEKDYDLDEFFNRDWHDNINPHWYY